MDKILNRFFIQFPKNTVFGWGVKIENIDIMRILATSHHKRRFCICDYGFPYVLKIKYLDLECCSSQYCSVNGNPSVFNTPFSNPEIKDFDNDKSYEKNYVVISRRFKTEDECVKFATDIKLHIDTVGDRIDDYLDAPAR